jgi:predicted DsbA family dithiol-disulfide isomerase
MLHTTPAPIQLEVFFDLSCPFCLLAKVTIDDVLRSATVPVDITWSPLIMLPWIPAGGLDFQSSHAAKYGDRSRPMQLQVERRAHELGVKIDHSRVTRVPNTLEAHRAVRFAAESGRTSEMIETILRWYLGEGCDIGDREALGEVVHSLGLNAAEFQARMATDWHCAELRAASEDSARRGARSVPSYRLNGVHIENTVDLVPRLRALTTRERRQDGATTH